MGADILSYGEAYACVAAEARKLQRRAHRVESVVLAGAAGRILAAQLASDRDQPPFARSTRDGFAVRASELMSKGPLPVVGSVRAGEAATGPLPRGAAWEIMTGAPVPVGADAVVMLEHVEQRAGLIRLLAGRKLERGANVVARGAQARAGKPLLKPGVRIDAAQIALAASCGAAELMVYAKPRIAILTTGDELVAVNAEPGPAQIRNSNAPMLETLVAQAGGTPLPASTVADTASALDAALARALDADLLVISGGVSAGKFDLVEPALARLGAKFRFTGVRMQPGKPLAFGAIPRAGTGPLPFLGLPGNPISSAVTFLLFGAPLVQALSGAAEYGPRFAAARLAEATDRRANPALTRFLPAHCAPGSDALPAVTPVPWHGSGDLAAFARANAFLVVPEGTATLKAGATVRVLVL